MWVTIWLVRESHCSCAGRLPSWEWQWSRFGFRGMPGRDPALLWCFPTSTQSRGSQLRRGSHTFWEQQQGQGRHTWSLPCLQETSQESATSSQTFHLEMCSHLATKVMPLGAINLQCVYFLCKHVFWRGICLLPAHSDQFWVCSLLLTYAFWLFWLFKDYGVCLEMTFSACHLP